MRIGSRGIAHIKLSIRTVVEVLSSLGITESEIDAPIICTSETVELGRTPGGYIFHFNQKALQVDALLLVNRVKPYTSSHGEIKSGLYKMAVIGLGNAMGAKCMHSYGYGFFPRLIPGMAREISERTKIIGGIALVENDSGDLKHVEFLSKEVLIKREKELLKMARDSMPRLPFKDIDILIIKEMGKCYSGTGMDTNVIGRYGIEGVEDPKEPKIKRIVVLKLADSSHGNATGIGLADIITKRVFEGIDCEKTYKNVMAIRCLRRGMIPLIA